MLVVSLTSDSSDAPPFHPGDGRPVVRALRKVSCGLERVQFRVSVKSGRCPPPRGTAAGREGRSRFPSVYSLLTLFVPLLGRPTRR